MLAEYKCKKCGERVTEFTTKPKKKIPCVCGAKMERILSPHAVVFKGSRP